MHNRTFYGEELYPSSAEDNFINYQYKCESKSLLYNYIHSPLAQHIVDNYIPQTVA